MIIHSMTATFGKLEHQTLELRPGLTVIEAPNEWGKTTWCAFLIAMLYGLDTRAKSTKNALADKERYAPWSGSPMAGRIDLEWNGRRITIERKSKGRVPLGVFSAYETESGLPVPELTAANCGQLLLGVERSVFQRAGFIRAGDLGVTQDEALRARLNALVTTGDESGDAERLGKALKDMKNRCRYHRSGLIPQAESEKQALEAKLQDLEALEYQCGKISQRQEHLQVWIRQLENHNLHLAWSAAMAGAQRVAQAAAARDTAAARLSEQETICSGLPPRQEAETTLFRLRKLQQDCLDVQMEAQLVTKTPAPPAAPAPFEGLSGQQAVEQATRDAQEYAALQKGNPLPVILGILAIVAGGITALRYLIYGIVLAAVGCGVLTYALIRRNRRKKIATALTQRYGSDNPGQWQSLAESWAAAMGNWELTRRQNDAARQALTGRFGTLREQIETLTAQRNMSQWEDVLRHWDALAECRREAARAEEHLASVSSLTQEVPMPDTCDELTYSPQETARLISDANNELTRLAGNLNQYQGRMEAMGDREAMRSQVEALTRRIARLEDIYTALDIGLNVLTEASMELQRRFAPVIAKRAQELMGAFTGGRYDRLTLGQDLSLKAGAENEDILHDALWRSEGTVDQLYLALRLAVAEALTGDAPLILDDALVRFDDRRMKAAMDVLAQESQKKQVILFTCQSREKALINQ